MKRIYISGPISGIDKNNAPAFAAAQYALESMGLEVVNPCVSCARPEWHRAMRLAIAELVTCDAVFFLPGWHHSRGARLEFSLAHDLEIPGMDSMQEVAEWIGK